jgi:hypothetical protein
MVSLICGTTIARGGPNRAGSNFAQGQLSPAVPEQKNRGSVIYFTLRYECRRDIGTGRRKMPVAQCLDNAKAKDGPSDQSSANMGLARRRRLTL